MSETNNTRNSDLKDLEEGKGGNGDAVTGKTTQTAPQNNVENNNIAATEQEEEDEDDEENRKKLAILLRANTDPSFLEENHAPSPPAFIISVDEYQDYKATQLKICSFRRPHMRAFHYSWFSFCTAFFLWFAIAPLLPEVRESLNLDDSDIWVSNIVAVSSNIFMRFIFGAVCDKFGARIPMAMVLMLAAIPTALTGLANTLTGLCALRFFIGVAGSCFVMSQYWSARMFTKEIAGTASALVAGWGNVGGGLTQIVMGSALFPLFRNVFYSGDDNASEKAWRIVCIIPAVVAFATGLIIIKTSDDCPLGNYSQLKKEETMPEISATTSFRRGAWDLNTWLLYFQYGACFGVELTMNNAAATNFHDEFGLSTESASAIASIFGFMNLFARGLGGFTSDKANAKMGMKGRLLVQMLFLMLEGGCIFIFATMKQLWAAILVLAIFSIFVQAAEGSTYGIVPYVNPGAIGSVAGIVGAGGPSGAVAFGFGFMFLSKARDAYFLMGASVLLASLLSLAMSIRGHGGLFLARTARDKWRQSVILSVPSPDEDTGGEVSEEVAMKANKEAPEADALDKLSAIAEEPE